MIIHKTAGALIVLLFLFYSCEKPPEYDVVPNIWWGEFSKDTVDQLTGVVTFKFNFTDGDGDIGKQNDTTNHIIIVDTRRIPNDTLFYQMPEIEQQGSISSISGEVEVTISQFCCIDPQNPFILCQNISNYYNPVVYKIRIKDNAGRWSNEIETPPLHIKCFN